MTRWLICLAGLYAAMGLACAEDDPTPPVADSISVNSSSPAFWARLNDWRQSLTAEEWRTALDERFAPHDAAKGLIDVGADALYVRMSDDGSPLFFGLPNRAPTASRPGPPLNARYWRTRDELGPATPDRPLEGLHIALDPGHLGGQWGVMEERSFSVDGRPPVQEGDLTLRVAQLLKPQLEALGAQVSLVRDKPGPVTTDTPASLRPQAETQWLRTAAAKYGAIPPAGDPRREGDIQKLAEQLFYRVSEIEARARRVNEQLKPDLVLCLHFDGADWPDPQKLSLVASQHFHILVNGSYLPAELAGAETRLDMLERIASGAGTEELAAALAMAAAAVPIFGLPAQGYGGPNAVALGGDGYVWGRNLLANRLYRCPVVFLEPYVMNSVEGYERIQAGEYAGTRDFGGRARKNIFAEYSDAVIAGLVNYYGKRASPPATTSPFPPEKATPGR